MNVAPGFILSNPASRKQWESYGSEGQERPIEASIPSGLEPPKTSQQRFYSWQAISPDGLPVRPCRLTEGDRERRYDRKSDRSFAVLGSLLSPMAPGE